MSLEDQKTDQSWFPLISLSQNDEISALSPNDDLFNMNNL